MFTYFNFVFIIFFFPLNCISFRPDNNVNSSLHEMLFLIGEEHWGTYCRIVRTYLYAVIYTDKVDGGDKKEFRKKVVMKE